MRHNKGLLALDTATRSYLPLQSPLGFGIADWIALVLAIAGLLFMAWLRPQSLHFNSAVHRLARFLDNCGSWFFFALTLGLRLLLLRSHPIPIPSGADDFAYLLLGGTFAHFRWTNPPLPNASFFETVFVLQQPTYSSIFPPAQGFILAVGQGLFGVPWMGVLLSMSLLAALCHWMLRGWLSSRWASVGALLAVFFFGPLCAWMNCYWGGAAAAMAGCLVFGSLGRLRQSSRPLFALTAGLGLGWHLLSRPFETVLMALSIILFWALFLRSAPPLLPGPRIALLALGFAPFVAVLLIHSHAVTGHWTKLPYALSREQYGVPTTFTFQPAPVPTRSLTQEQKNDYDAQAFVRGDGHENLARFFLRLIYRLRFLRFFLCAPLYLALLVLLLKPPTKDVTWAAGTVLLFLIGTNVYPYFYPHYIAGLASLLLLLTVAGLRALKASRLGPWASAWLFSLCALQFALWFGVQVSGLPSLILGLGSFETWDYLNFGDPQGRSEVQSKLSQAPGKQLVFVHLAPNHGFEEWISNPADLDRSREIRALDLGPSENLPLIRRFPERTVWLLHPDSHPKQLSPYPYLVDDMLVLPKAGTPATGAPAPKQGKSNKVSDWLEDVK